MTPTESFFEAVKAGRTGDVQAMLALSPGLARTHADGATALHFAALENHAALVTVLLDAGADPNAVDYEFGATPLGWANERGHTSIVSQLAEHTKLDLHRASAAGLIEHVRQLLKRDASAVNTVSGFGTPIHEATVFGHEDIVELLLAHGADPQAQNRDGDTALTIAQAQAESNAKRTPIISSERRSEIVEACSRIAERLRSLST